MRLSEGAVFGQQNFEIFLPQRDLSGLLRDEGTFDTHDPDGVVFEYNLTNSRGEDNVLWTEAILPVTVPPFPDGHGLRTVDRGHTPSDRSSVS